MSTNKQKSEDSMEHASVLISAKNKNDTTNEKELAVRPFYFISPPLTGETPNNCENVFEEFSGDDVQLTQMIDDIINNRLKELSDSNSIEDKSKSLQETSSQVESDNRRDYSFLPITDTSHQYINSAVNMVNKNFIDSQYTFTQTVSTDTGDSLVSPSSDISSQNIKAEGMDLCSSRKRRGRRMKEEERKLRRKEQNRRASRRHYNKVRHEIDSLALEEQTLIQRNKQLRCTLSELNKEKKILIDSLTSKKTYFNL